MKSIADIAKERGVEAREVFIKDIEARGFSATGDTQFAPEKGPIYANKRGWKCVVGKKRASADGKENNSFALPYTAITLALITAVAGERK